MAQNKHVPTSAHTDMNTSMHINAQTHSQLEATLSSFPVSEPVGWGSFDIFLVAKVQENHCEPPKSEILHHFVSRQRASETLQITGALTISLYASNQNRMKTLFYPPKCCQFLLPCRKPVYCPDVYSTTWSLLVTAPHLWYGPSPWKQTWRSSVNPNTTKAPLQHRVGPTEALQNNAVLMPGMGLVAFFQHHHFI